MASSRYALVAYLHHPVGQFVEELRRELHPVIAHMPAHLTILPPRELRGTESRRSTVRDTPILTGIHRPIEEITVLLGATNAST